MGGKKLRIIGGSVLLALAAAYVYVGVDVSPHVEYVQEPSVVEDTIPDPPSAYGIPLDGFVMEQEKVPAGATFSDLLSAHGLAPATIDSLVKLAAPVFDIHRMRAGHPFALIFTDDDARVPSYFVYEADQVEHVVFALRPPMDVQVGRREVRTEEKSVSVAVTGALWSDLQKAGVDPALTVKLSEVFAWTVDFYRIQKGDRFTVVYRQHTVDGRPYGAPDVLGVRYEGSYTREAFRFGEGSALAYYDAEGNSLRKAFLKAPLKYSRISSGFTLRRFHPVQKRYKAHLGTDYASPYGTPILAVGDGVVEKAGYSAGNGNFVKIRHNGIYETQYLHMRKILVKNGQRVQQGQTIGEVGSTGLATGPHVCFRFWKNGEQVDPRREEFPSAEPVPATEKAAFDQVRDGLLAKLDHAEHEAQRVSSATF
ncbi:MAG: peptidoglycan DD-metalloendopeptidase family protein [Flavobacteriales bacterium]